MKLITTDKAFYRRLLSIAVPVSLQSLILFGVSMADTVMVGMLSEVHLSAVSLANQLGFIYALFTFGVAGGSNVMIAQYWGKGDVESIHKVLAIMYRILLAGGIVFTCLALFFNRQVMSIFSTDERVIAEGAKFLRILGFSYLLMGISSTTVVMLRSVGAVKIALATYISSLFTNTFFNWMLIFGKLGAPRLEVEGAAIATCICRVVEFVIICVYMLKIDRKIQFKLRHLFIKKIGLLRDFVRHAGPVVVNEFLWGAGTATLAIVIGRMGTEFTAANSICGILSQLVTITIFGAANAAASLVGNTIGEGEYEKAQTYGTTLICLSVALGLVACGVVHILKYPMISLYNVSDTVLLYARQIINVYSVVVIVQSVSAMALVGVMRGGGDTRYSLFLDVFFMWCVCVPLGFFAGFKLALAVPAVYFIIKCDEFFKAVFCLIRILSGKWVNDVTRPRGEIQDAGN